MIVPPETAVAEDTVTILCDSENAPGPELPPPLLVDVEVLVVVVTGVVGVDAD